MFIKDGQLYRVSDLIKRGVPVESAEAYGYTKAEVVKPPLNPLIERYTTPVISGRKLVYGKERLTGAAFDRGFAQLKSNVVAERINRPFEVAMTELVSGYPEREIASWPQQEKEARLWVEYLAAVAAGSAPPQPPTPMLDALSAARGVTKDRLAQTVVQKANAFAAAAGALIGKRQALEDAINAATTVEELEAIQW